MRLDTADSYFRPTDLALFYAGVLLPKKSVYLKVLCSHKLTDMRCIKMKWNDCLPEYSSSSAAVMVTKEVMISPVLTKANVYLSCCVNLELAQS